MPGVGNTADTPNNPWVTTLVKEIWESPLTKENLAPVGYEPMTSGTDLPVLYRLSYEASTGASWGNLGSKFAVSIQMKPLYIAIIDGNSVCIKAGVHLKAVFWLGIMFLIQISRLRFRQSRISSFITHIYVWRRFVNFWGIFRFIWR